MGIPIDLSPAGRIARLDVSLARAGSTIKIRRVGSMDVTCPATVRSPTAEELIGGYKQADSLVILSPTPLTAAGFGLPIKAGVGGDKAVIDGRARQVEVYDPFVIGGAVVRIELRVLG